MKVTCEQCKQEYDDVYRNTMCPHKEFEMHCGVSVNGKNGCAHTVEELTKAVEDAVLPNPDCEYMLGLEGLRKTIEAGRIIDRAIDDLNAEIAANGGVLPDEIYSTESES